MVELLQMARYLASMAPHSGDWLALPIADCGLKLEDDTVWVAVGMRLGLSLCNERPSKERRRACGRPRTSWIHQICRDMGVTAPEALQLAEDRPFWRIMTMAGVSAEHFASR